jgi:hypothetical protein
MKTLILLVLALTNWGCTSPPVDDEIDRAIALRIASQRSVR